MTTFSTSFLGSSPSSLITSTELATLVGGNERSSACALKPWAICLFYPRDHLMDLLYEIPWRATTFKFTAKSEARQADFKVRLMPLLDAPPSPFRQSYPSRLLGFTSRARWFKPRDEMSFCHLALLPPRALSTSLKLVSRIWDETIHLVVWVSRIAKVWGGCDIVLCRILIEYLVYWLNVSANGICTAVIDLASHQTRSDSIHRDHIRVL